MKISNIISSLGIVSLLIVFATPWSIRPSFAQVSTEYLPNYGLSQTWERIATNFIAIQAAKTRGDTVPSSVFQQLSTDFQVVFPQLPQRNNYRITYDNCRVQSQKLSIEMNAVDFDIFVDQCQSPINTIIKEINSNYTVKADVKASPQSGSAPLTVTLDARASTDPSNDTIPSNNFYWYYKNTQGVDVVIGRGSVISYTFDTEGTYYVHLTAKSANKSTEGIQDGRATTIINVAPEIANLVVYANGKRLQEKTYTKIGTTEARNGVVFDGSATLPKGGREVMSHSWEFAGANGYKYFSDTIPGGPGTIRLQLPDNGSYTVKLSLTDNENNTITKSFLVAVSDPIAIIKQNPEQVTTTTQVSFDAGASYSINSRIRRYNWEVYNEAGDREIVSQQKIVTHKFVKPGSYTVKLTVTDELNEVNTETKIIEVESTSPQAQFTITPRLDRQFPSQFVFDATSSFDVDVIAGFDALTYEWTFSNPSLTKVEQTYDDGQSVVVSFNQPGKHMVTLTVKDSFGKISTLSREVNVQSSLRPIILVNPRANSWGNTTRFMVTTNNEILNYEWDFGDGQKSIVNEPTTNYMYRTSGVYNVKLTATDRRGDKNSISTLVFVGNKDLPIGAYSVLNARQNILRADQVCQDKDAYMINRGERFSINTTDSVNTKGQKNGLVFYFTPQNDEIYKSTNFSYSFRNIGCQKIDLMVEDTLAGKTDTQTIWFLVVNSLPTLDSMSMYFPQFGNEVGIGLNQAAQERVTFDPLKVNPLIVKVTANNPKDSDGTVSQYVWYYYKADDPTRMIEIKSTPGNVPYTHFTIYTNDPALGGGNIVFGVKLIDNDSGEKLSEEVIGQGPAFFIPPCTTSGICDQSMDVPIVTLTVDDVDVSVGDKVRFRVNARTLSNRPDFATQRVVRYDFNGDGVWDKVTKDLEAEYVFAKASESIVPRVEVTYRKNTVAVNGPEITVQQDLKVKLESAIHDKTVYIRDFSMGDIFKKEVCFDLTRECTTNTDEDFLSYTYETYGEKTVKYTIYDNFGNRAVGFIVIDLKEPTEASWMDLVSIPRSIINSEGRYVVSIGNDQNNQVFLNAVYKGQGTCYIDLDINDDSNYDGKPDNDKDLLCNTPRYIKLDDYVSDINARIIYEGPDGNLIGNGIIFVFTEQSITMTPTQKLSYNKIIALMKSLPSVNDDQVYIKSLLQEMAENVKLTKNQTETIINLRVYLENTKAGLTDSQIQSIHDLIKEFETSDTIALEGGNIVDQVRQFLIDYAPGELMKAQISDAFAVIQALPEPAAKPEIVKTQLATILNIFNENSVTALDSQNPGNEEKIIDSDVETQILPRICEVLNFYTIASPNCPDADGTNRASESTETTVMGRVIKWVGITVGVLGGIFLLIVIFFAVKARLQQNADETTPE